MTEHRYPSRDGLEAAIADLAGLSAGRVAAHVPVLLAIESALEAREFQEVEVASGDGAVPLVPNTALVQRLEEWFGVAGQDRFPYFSPLTLPGGKGSLHWRNRGIVAQNTMTAAKHRGWVAAALTINGTRGYPLLNLAAWREEAARSVGNDAVNERGVDLATFGIWLARTSGVTCDGQTPTRDELVAAALGILGLRHESVLLTAHPALFSVDGDYVPSPEHFVDTPLPPQTIAEIALATEAPASEADLENTDALIPAEDWLRDRFEEWRRAGTYPNPYDENQNALREELANGLFQEGPLAQETLDLPLFRRFVANNYGGPGSQSHMMRFLRDNPETGPSRLAATLHHLLYGDGDYATRLQEVLEDPAWRIPGFGESLATKCLAVRYPDRWLALFVYRSGGGVGKRDFMRLMRLEALDETGKTVGELAVESNDRVRERTEPLLPGDPWGQGMFLWWLRNWAPTSSLAEELLLPQSWLDEIDQLSQEKPQLIFYGPPGTGKTFVAKRLAQSWADPDNVAVVQFHPSYSYEDFVQGYRPTPNAAEQLGFRLRNGPLMRLAQRARETGERCVLLIDEINRGNISKIFGELYFLLEYRDEEIELQYGDKFSLPENLFIIGTMNTADTSIALIDAALRRRFHFVPFFPDREPIKALLRRWLNANAPEMLYLADVVDLANALLDDRNLQIGPSHFMVDGLDTATLTRIWTYSILPYIEEHVFDEPERVDEFGLVALCAQLDGNGALTPVAATDGEEHEGADMGDAREDGENASNAGEGPTHSP